MKQKIRIITHDRVAHADDALAAAILRIVFQDVEVVRTRDPAILRAEAGKPGSILVDVGGRYDPARDMFDHHQPDGAGCRTPETGEWPYASAGLVWKAYGAQAVRATVPGLTDEGVQETAQYIDDSFLKYVDAVDCGRHVRSAGPSFSAIIGSFNTTWYEKEEEVFPLVMELSQVVLVNMIKRHAGQVLARDLVRQAPRMVGGQVLVLSGCMPWSKVVADEMPDVKLVIYPVDEEQDGKWQVRAAHDPDNTLRIKMPATWAGLEGQALSDASGTKGAVFCHRSRHLAGAQTQGAVLYMAQLALSASMQERHAELLAA